MQDYYFFLLYAILGFLFFFFASNLYQSFGLVHIKKNYKNLAN